MNLSMDTTIRSDSPPLSRRRSALPARRFATWGPSAAICASAPAAGISAVATACSRCRTGKSLVPNGENRYHAIFGGGPAYFVSPSSLGPALAALGAHVTIASPSGTRSVEVQNFFLIPKTGNDREIDLHPNEIVTEIVIPDNPLKNATYEVRHKEALDWPLATASVALKMSGSKVSSARIVMGHVAPTPWEASAAEKSLTGKSIDEATAEMAAEEAVRGAQPLSQNGYKVQLAKVAVKRALLAAVQKA